jgi:hypothetical protein
MKTYSLLSMMMINCCYEVQSSNEIKLLILAAPKLQNYLIVNNFTGAVIRQS